MSLLQSAGGHLLSAARSDADILLGASRRHLGYADNRWGYRSSPPPDAVLAAYWSGRLGDPAGRNAKERRDTLLAEHGIYWDGNAAQYTAVTDAYTTGTLLDRGLAWMAWVDLSKPYPDFATLRSAWLRNMAGADTDTLVRALQREGITDSNWQTMLLQLGQTAGWQEILEWWRRGWIDQVTAESFLRWADWLSPTQTGLMVRAYDSTLLPERAVIEGVWRLSPDQVQRYAGTVPGLLPIGQADTDYTLQVAGYDSTRAAQLQALSRPVLGHRQILMARRLGVVGDDVVRNRTQAEGWLPDDTQILVDLAAAEADRPATDRVARALEEAYDLGTIEILDFGAQLKSMGFSQRYVDRMAAAIDSTHAMALVKETLAEIRGELLAGNISVPQAAGALAELQITPRRANQYILLWQAQHTLRVRTLQTGEILSLFADGVIDETTATARLTNLQWANPDGLLLLARAKMELVKRETAGRNLPVKGLDPRAAELARLAAEAAKQQKLLCQQSRQAMPIADLKRFYKDGIIEIGEVEKYLSGQCYSPEFVRYTIDDMLRPAKSATVGARGRPNPEKGETPVALAVLLEDGIIDSQTYQDRLVKQGYPGEFISWSLRELIAKGKITAAQAAPVVPMPPPPSSSASGAANGSAAKVP